MTTIKTTRESLLDPLQSVIGIVEKKHTMAVLSNVLILCSGQSLSMTATDLEVQIRTNPEPAMEIDPETIRFAVSAKKLHDILRNLPENCALNLELGEGRVTIKSGKSRFNVQTVRGEDFPTVKTTETPGVILNIPQKTLKTLLERVQFAMAQQDVRYYLNGALLQVVGNQLTVVATDGHRLSYTMELLPEYHEKIEAIIPRKTIFELIKLLSPTDEMVRMTLRSNQVEFLFGNIELLSKVIDGKFPDYNRVIPSNYNKHITLQRLELLQSLQRATILSNEKIKGVRLLLAKNCLAIVCTNSEMEEAKEEIDVDYDQEPMDIGFNFTYLLDVMNHMNVERMICSLGDANSSLLISVPEAEERFKYVVMPMRI